MKHFKYFPTIEYDGETVTDIFKRNIIQNKVKNIISSYSDVMIQDDHRPDSLSYDYYSSVDYTWILFYANDIFDPLTDWVKNTNDFNEYLIHKYQTADPSRVYKSIGKIKNAWLVDNSPPNAVLKFKINRFAPLKIGDTIKHPYRDEFRKVASIGTNNQFSVYGTFSLPFPSNSTSLESCEVLTDIHSYWQKSTGLQIDYRTWSLLPEEDRYAKTFYEFEFEENENKRRLQLIGPESAKDLQNQLIRFFK